MQTGRWGDLARHRRFGENHELHDIHDQDWPSVKPDILAAIFPGFDPLPVPAIDLVEAAAAGPSGEASTVLAWAKLTSNDFERLLADLLEALTGYQNAAWVTKTNAPDGGRDLSAEKVTTDAAGLVRTDRVILQAKHWRSQSLTHTDFSNMLADVQLLEPPPVTGSS